MGYLKTLDQAENLLAQDLGFTTGTLTATLGNDGVYRVFSYQTEIANRGKSEPWLNPVKYSQTTSRHLNIVKRAWGLL